MPKPYRAPSNGGGGEENGQENKLRDIKRSLQRFSTGSTENLSSGPERKSSAVNTITRVIKRQMTKERSGSQPNLSNICSESLSPPQLSSFSPSMSNLSPAMAKIEISRGPTVSVPPVKLQEVPIGVRGSPDGASIRSESPLPPSEGHEDMFKGRVEHFVVFEKLVFVITSRILRLLMKHIDIK